MPNEHLNNAFSQYSGRSSLDWLHNFSRHHQVKPNTGLFHLNERDDAGYTLTDYLTHDQLFNGSTVTRAIAEYWADSPDETERLVESTIRGGGFGDDLEEMSLNSLGIRQEQKNLAYLFKHKHSLRIGFFLDALGCASDYVEQLNELLNQLRLKAHENKRAENDEEHELLNQIRETDKKLGVLSEFERHSNTEHIVRQMATSYHAPAVQVEAPKGNGGNHQGTEHVMNECKAYLWESVFPVMYQKGSGYIQKHLKQLAQNKVDGWYFHDKDNYLSRTTMTSDDDMSLSSVATWLGEWKDENSIPRKKRK